MYGKKLGGSNNSKRQKKSRTAKMGKMKLTYKYASESYLPKYQKYGQEKIQMSTECQI